MPFATKENGYPVEEAKAATAVVEEQPATEVAARALKPSAVVQPSLKDRSIINQTAWKVAAMLSSAIGNYYGSKDDMLKAIQETKEKIEVDMLSVYKS